MIDLAFVERSFVYHTSRDRVKGMRRGSAQASGENIVAFVGAFLQKRDQFADVDSELNPDISLRQGVESHAWYVRPGFILAKTKVNRYRTVHVSFVALVSVLQRVFDVLRRKVRIWCAL